MAASRAVVAPRVRYRPFDGCARGTCGAPSTGQPVPPHEPPRDRGRAGDCAVAHDSGLYQESSVTSARAAEWWSAPGVLCRCAWAGGLVWATVARGKIDHAPGLLWGCGGAGVYR